MNAKLKFITISPVLGASLLIFACSAQAGTWAGFRRLDATSSRTSSGADSNGAKSVVNANIGGAKTNRGGLDDPMNHDMGEDRGMTEPGDNNGRHHRRHRGHH